MFYIEKPTPTENVLLLQIEILSYKVEKTELIGKIILQKRTEQDYKDMSKRLRWVEQRMKDLETESLQQRNDIYNLENQIKRNRNGKKFLS